MLFFFFPSWQSCFLSPPFPCPCPGTTCSFITVPTFIATVSFSVFFLSLPLPRHNLFLHSALVLSRKQARTEKAILVSRTGRQILRNPVLDRRGVQNSAEQCRTVQLGVALDVYSTAKKAIMESNHTRPRSLPQYSTAGAAAPEHRHQGTDPKTMARAAFFPTVAFRSTCCFSPSAASCFQLDELWHGLSCSFISEASTAGHDSTVREIQSSAVQYAVAQCR